MATGPSSAMAQPWSVGVAAVWLATAGCATTGPQLVPHHPWIEDAAMALADEQLEIRIEDRQVRVQARFTFAFREVPADRLLTFPIPPPCAATADFTASLEGEGAVPVQLHTERSAETTSLPMGPVAERYDIHLPGDALDAHGGCLVVRYGQRCTDSFRYTLLSGAYWHGPIGHLSVTVLDSERRVVTAEVEKSAPHRHRAGRYSWSFRDIEPRGGVSLALRWR